MKDQIIRDCKFALCHYNKTKKISTQNFAAFQLKNIIKIIPELQENHQLNTGYSNRINAKKETHDAISRDRNLNANNQHFRPYRRPNSNE